MERRGDAELSETLSQLRVQIHARRQAIVERPEHGGQRRMNVDEFGILHVIRIRQYELT